MHTYESPRPSSGLSMGAFDYPLPPERIAQTPIEPRDAARLLVSVGTGPSRHLHVSDLPSLLLPGDVLVLNETKVIPARLVLRKPTGGAVEILLLDLIDAADHRAWKALVKPSRKVAPGSVLRSDPDLDVEIGDRLDGGQRLVTLRDPATSNPLDPADEEDRLSRHGTMPLPPYITETLADQSRYQTTFAQLPGSAAAPTAGLHFTPELLEKCRAAGASVHTVELRVGLDTFRPVTVERPEDHEIHSERFRVPAATLAACREAKAHGGRVIAVGTTSVRALESAAAAEIAEGRTRLFIYGDYEFRLVDVLLTNFHLPKSSLLLLVQAFCGDRWRSLYDEAIHERYRFLSFGDALLLSRRASPDTFPA
jgi:S-adenosylmethionine:tRNA ribosyltransferase-isomerase